MQEEKTFKQELSKWIKEKLPYWKQYLASSILFDKKVTESTINKAYGYFLQEHSLHEGEELKKEDIELMLSRAIIDVGDLLEGLALTSISKFKNISAIKDGQVIDLNPQLTILFGENGAGKTSYVRLLSNSFQSRGEKELLPNIYIDGEFHSPSCLFKFEKGEDAFEYTFPDDVKNPEFQLFTVYDSKSFRVHIESKNELLFLPKDFEFFNLMIEGLKKIETKHEDAISSRKKENSFISLFQSIDNQESDIIKYVSNLNSSSSIEELDNISQFDSEQELKIINLEREKARLISQEVETRLKEENGFLDNLLSLQKNILTNRSSFSKEKISEFNSLISEFHIKKQSLEDSSIENFLSTELNGLGSTEWRIFIKSAFDFSEKHIENYPNNPAASCILCNQALSHESSLLISSFWNYINSAIEDEFQKVNATIENEINQLKSLPFNQLESSSYLFYKLSLYSIGEKRVLLWKKNLLNLASYRDAIVKSLSDKVIIEHRYFADDLFELETIIEEVRVNIKKLQEDNPSLEIQRIKNEIEIITHKRILNSIRNEVEGFINNLKWILKATIKLSDLNSSSVTRKQREFFDKFIAGSYLSQFQNECTLLNAEFNVAINQEGKKGNTLRELKIKGFALNRVLSEGEQRAISLADFLTEINLSKESKGIILDDPVNSLDHRRKRIIAERFIEESLKRQVIIFTHDLMFVSYLKIASEQKNINLSCHWIQKTSDGAGQVYLNNSPANESDYKNADVARGFYKRAKEVGPQEQEQLLKQGFGALRTNYEAFVIFELFSDVVQRFNERISIGRLKEVVIDDEIVKQVIEKTESLSRFIEGHLHSDEYVFNKPTPDLLNSEILAFEELKKKQRSLKKAKLNT